MALLLIDVEQDLLVEIPVSEAMAETLLAQWGRLPDDEAKDAFGRRFGARLEPALTDSLDWDLKPPTAPQLAFATSISRTLGVAVPTDVLRHRGAMNEFLDQYGDSFKAKVNGPKKNDSANVAFPPVSRSSMLRSQR